MPTKHRHGGYITYIEYTAEEWEEFHKRNRRSTLIGRLIVLLAVFFSVLCNGLVILGSFSASSSIQPWQAILLTAVWMGILTIIGKWMWNS